MATLHTVNSLADAGEAKRLQAIIAQCFNAPADDDRYFDRIGRDNFRVVRRESEIAGGLALIEMGQWFGGQRVPMTGIAAVGIAPEHRGSGAALVLMQETVKQLHEKGVPISVLYPATQQLYRKAGYEQGGLNTSWTVSTATIALKDRVLPIQPIEPTAEICRKLYAQQAQSINGHLDRHAALWQEIAEPEFEKAPVYAYLIGDTATPQGYVICQHSSQGGESVLRICDWVALTAEAKRTFWTFLADHRSQIDTIRWRSSPIDSLSLLLSEQPAKIQGQIRWLMRIVDVPKALEQRGYPIGLETELHLQIHDELISANHDRFVLSVTNGKATVTRGGRGELKIAIRGLSPLYTGLFSAHQLQQAGYLQADDAALSIATQLFLGHSPWMRDFF